MLHSLLIKNFILIDQLELEFGNGFNVFTGETGAGKSIILKALLFCLNNIKLENPVKKYMNSCEVTAIFSLTDKIKTILFDKNIEYSDELVIRRTQTIDNKKKFLINDQVVTGKTITEISQYLIELHGQNTQTELLNPSIHIEILDEYGQLGELRLKLYNIYKNLQKAEKELNEYVSQQNELTEEIEYLEFVIQELLQAKIFVNEEDELSELRRKLQNHDKEVQSLKEINSIVENIDIFSISSKITKIIQHSNIKQNNSESILKSLDNTVNNIDDITNLISEILSSKEYSKQNLEEIEERLFKIRAIARKHSISCDEIPQFLNSCIKNLELLKNKLANLDHVQSEIDKFKIYYDEVADNLSQARDLTAIKLELAIHNELKYLDMDKVKLKVEFFDADKRIRNSRGFENARFMLSTNLGSPYYPIDKIASGGELSRFMLALKTVLVNNTNTQIIIFDEIDTGISGMVADKVGECMRNLSRNAQVIAITHQPQVATKANRHYLVTKCQLEDTTNIKAIVLDDQTRKEAIAKMISGKNITENTIRAVEDLYS